MWFFGEKKTNEVHKQVKNIQSVDVMVPAKLIVSGDHSVIYNSQAVICAVNIFLNVKIHKIASQKIIIKDGKNTYQKLLKDFSIEHANDNQILEIIRIFFDTTKIPLRGMKIVIKNNIPIGCGLGSSSALVCGIVFGLNKIFNCRKKIAELISISTQIENIFHGKSSGADIHTVVKGGIIYFNKGKTKKIAHQIDEIWIVDTGRPSFSTHNVVEYVFDNFASSNDLWSKIGKLTTDIAKIMPGNEKVKKKIEQNEKFLEKIGVVTEKTKEFINNLKEQKIYAKICGAGTIAEREVDGGNGIIGIFQTLTYDQQKYLKTICKNNKMKFKKVYISNSGIKIFKK